MAVDHIQEGALDVFRLTIGQQTLRRAFILEMGIVEHDDAVA